MAVEKKSHRPVVMGVHGMVSTGHPLASSAAVDILKKGGNAIDAALCASGVLSVVKSYHCGLGGDIFGVFYSAREKRVLVLNGSGRSPKLIHRELYSEDIPHRGILAANVPGAVDAWVEAANRLGTRSIRDLLKPALLYAEEGFPVFHHLETVIRSSYKTLGSDPAWARIFLPEGKMPRIGDLLVQKDLANTLSRIADGEREAFYEGEVANAIIKTSERHGGYFSLNDFFGHRSRWEEPLCAKYRGYEVCVPPPNSYGLLLLLQLKILEDYDLSNYGHNTPRYVALQVKAKEEAWRKGNYWIADPDQYKRTELSEFLNNFPKILGQNTPDVPLSKGGSNTTYIATADEFGNWASLIQSVHQSFGCGVVVDGTGIVLNNRMSGFNLTPNHPNELAPDKLPAHTLSPALVLKNNAPVLAIGTPGGCGQTEFLVQTLCNLFDFKMNVQEATEAPRWLSEHAGRVDIESRLSTEVRDLLSKGGYDVRECGPWEFAFGGVEAVYMHQDQKVLMGAADPRRDGYAIGY